MSNIAFLTVVYPGANKYFYEFLQSLRSQTVQGFDLLLLNDKNVDTKELRNCQNIEIIELLFYDKSPAEIREAGIRYCFENKYSTIVFGDIDDFFYENRIEECINLLECCDIVVNDLDIIYENTQECIKNYLSNRFVSLQEIKIEDILYKNCFGLSNTAIKLANLQPIIIDSTVVAIDWYIFSCFLLNGAKAMFTNETSTCYRQHNDNTIGMAKLNKEYLLKGGRVKSCHYSKMAEIDTRFQSLYKKNKKIIDKQFNNTRLSELIDDLKIKQNEYPLWWEDVGVRN